MFCVQYIDILFIPSNFYLNIPPSLKFFFKHSFIHNVVWRAKFIQTVDHGTQFIVTLLNR